MWPCTPPSDGTAKVLRPRDVGEWGSRVFVYTLNSPGEPMEQTYGCIGDLTMPSSCSGEFHPHFNYCYTRETIS